MEDIKQLLEEIDKIDDSVVSLFQKRMEITTAVAEYKKANGLPPLDPSRERQILASISDKVSENYRSYICVLYSLLFELSRSNQEKILHPTSELKERIVNAVENTEKLFPQYALVACQGVEGAYSQLACEKMFNVPNIMYFKTFKSVFDAIDKDMCRYGVLPVENSTAGTVNEIYDLMMDYNFNIIRSTRVKIDHNLLAKSGTKMSQIREIYSHEQAINQCTKFLDGLVNVKVTACANTAAAAKMVAESDRDDVAALSSRTCADLYRLAILSCNVQDNDNNYTRFICISKQLEIYPGADKTSIMMVIPHKPGALYKVLSRFYALGINLIKLESRPIPNRDFEFMFYFDLETSVYSEQFIQLVCGLEGFCEEFKYLGSYSEIV